MGRYGSYKEYGEDIWRIGWGSQKLGKHWVNLRETATYAQIEKQLIEDLKEFSNQVAEYVFVPLNQIGRPLYSVLRTVLVSCRSRSVGCLR